MLNLLSNEKKRYMGILRKLIYNIVIFIKNEGNMSTTYQKNPKSMIEKFPFIDISVSFTVPQFHSQMLQICVKQIK